MKHVRGFLFSLAFIGLSLLAFNPHIVVEIEKQSQRTPRIASFTPLTPAKQNPTQLPITAEPDREKLPRFDGFEKLAKYDTWIGTAPCRPDIFEPPMALPGLGPRANGPILTKAMNAAAGQPIVNQPTYLFKSENGITLKLVKPAIEYYTVHGREYGEAKNDIFDRRPLEILRQTDQDTSQPQSNRRPNKDSRVTRAADIFSPTNLSYTVSGSRGRYRLVKNETVLTSAFLITLPRWRHYNVASAKDQEKWDDFFCNVAHHELGHLRIRLDILAETLDGYSDLPPAYSSDEMKRIIIDYRKEISVRVQDRQDAYHIYNDGGLRRGMTELPYAELPFPWLEIPEIKTVEQSPE